MPVRSKRMESGPTYRLGDLLLRKGLITAEALQRALALQRAAIEADETPPRLGQILVKNRVLDRKTIKEILEDQKIARGEKHTLDIKLEPHDKVVILRLQGRLDDRTEARLVGVLERMIHRGVIRIALDAGGLLYASSAALPSLVIFVDEVRLRGGDLKIFSLHADVRVAFDQLELTKYIETLLNEKAAIDSFLQPNENYIALGALAEFVSTTAGRHYHLSFCPDNQKIPEDTRWYFRDRENAQQAGKLPCPKCIP